MSYIERKLKFGTQGTFKHSQFVVADAYHPKKTSHQIWPQKDSRQELFT